MINAIIRGPKDETLVWEFPGNYYKLERTLQDIGIREWPGCIHIVDEEDVPISVILYSEDDVGNHLIRMLTEKYTLDDVEFLTEAVAEANELIKKDLYQNIVWDRYDSPRATYQAIHDMTMQAASETETFYFPLSGVVFDEEDYEAENKVGNSFLVTHADEIQDAFCRYTERDTKNMATYYEGSGCSKVLLADWNFEYLNNQLYGKVEVQLTEPLTPEEKDCLKNWISGQNSDGLGEGFEQQDIKTEEGTLCVSFWKPECDYFIYDQEEMDAFTGQDQYPQMGGM